jgi:imidazolonepropionase
MQGAGYEAIAAAGGGIVSSMRSVREASVEVLEGNLRRRLRRMASLGTTTCEIKSGYGLSLESELRQLDAVAKVSKDRGLPRTVPTYLALHALPPEGREDRARWVDQVVNEWVGEIARSNLARFVDAYIDRNAFTVQEAERLFRAAADAGLGVRAHVGQFADVGGASLAASVKAFSVDHMEHVCDEALRALADAGTQAVLLPVASFTLRQAPPRVQAIRDAGVRIVVASDANPGTAPTESLTLALAFGLHTYGLTPQECLLGATRRAAISLGLESECGHLSPGTSADVVVWDLPHEHAILQPWASPMTRLVLRGGQVIHQSEP